jgi:hypothetical protein
MMQIGDGAFTVQLNRHDVPIVKHGKVVAHKTAFFGDIFVGQPSQRFTVVFDTGSGHIILPSTGCDSHTCMEKRRYSPQVSETARSIPSINGPLGEPISIADPNAKGPRERVSITFGTGQVTGEFVSDTICLSDQSPASCVDARLVSATQMTEDPFHSFKFDGVLGLSLAKLSLTPEFNFFGQMANQSQLDFQPQFAVYLSSTPSVSSEITFGGYHAARLAGPLQWAPVANPEYGYWNLKLKSVTVGSDRLSVCETGKCRAILDSGTSLLGVPRSELRNMHRMLARVLPVEHGEVDCRQFPGPPIIFDFGSFAITVTAEDYSRMGAASMQVAGGGPNDKRDFCRASLLPVDLQEPLGPAAFIMGEPVLRKFYTVFDYGRRQVGLGIARHPALNPEDTEPQQSPVVV